MTFDDEVKTALGRLISNASDDERSRKARSDLFDRYMAEPYGDEANGKSTFVSSDVSDAIESILPDLMDVFTSAENVVSFLPVGPEDEEAAKQETQVVNHIFWKQNPGFLLLYTQIKEALTQQNSYVKQAWVEKTRTEIEAYEDLDPQELMQIMGEKEGSEYEVLERSGFDIQQVMDPQTGQPVQQVIQTPGEQIKIKIRCVTREKRYEICNIPQEDFFHSTQWHSVSLDGIPVCGHKLKMEYGAAVAMGFDEESLKSAMEEADDTQTTDRHDTEDSPDYGDDENADEATRLVTVYEAYVRADIDGDGQAELAKVWAVGDGTQILQWEDGSDAIEEVSDHPFTCITPFIVPHRHVGRSLAELVTDVARVKTVLTRHALDSIYATNYPRPMFDDTQGGNADQLYNDLLNPAPGAPIRNGGIPVEWTKPQTVVPDIMPLLSLMDDLGEKRTGSTRYSQGLATEALNNAAASTVAQVRDWVTMKKMLIARVFAETGFKDLFRRIHKDLRSGPHKELVMQLRGQWVQVNPRMWKTRTDMTVSVGMGSGDRDTIREGLMLMGQTQEKWMAGGLPGVGPEQMRATVEKMAETYGIEDIGAYILPMDQIQQQPEEPPQPSPQEQMFQAQMQLEQQKMQQAQQKQQQEFELEKYKIDLDHQRKLQELQLKQQKVVLDDDRVRDVEELKAATGFQRDNPMRRELAPAVRYDQITGMPING